MTKYRRMPCKNARHHAYGSMQWQTAIWRWAAMHERQTSHGKIVLYGAILRRRTCMIATSQGLSGANYDTLGNTTLRWAVAWRQTAFRTRLVRLWFPCLYTQGSRQWERLIKSIEHAMRSVCLWRNMKPQKRRRTVRQHAYWSTQWQNAIWRWAAI